MIFDKNTKQLRVCNLVLCNDSDLQAHLRTPIHSEKDGDGFVQFYCEVCGKGFDRKSYCTTHERSCKGLLGKRLKFVCGMINTENIENKILFF